MRSRLPGRTSSPFARRLAAGLLAVSALVALQAPPAGAQVADGARHGYGSPARMGQGTRKPRPERVRAVLRAARSQLGTPYSYGGSRPGGFDCSGFTMWSWAHGGDSLPHNAAAQYNVVRWHVRRGHLEPGDLLFFYQPISHVAIFVGRNRMIEAPHSGERVRVVPIYWQYFTAAARPR